MKLEQRQGICSLGIGSTWPKMRVPTALFSCLLHHHAVPEHRFLSVPHEEERDTFSSKPPLQIGTPLTAKAQRPPINCLLALA